MGGGSGYYEWCGDHVETAVNQGSERGEGNEWL
jgi:hypothetical protein